MYNHSLEKKLLKKFGFTLLREASSFTWRYNKLIEGRGLKLFPEMLRWDSPCFTRFPLVPYAFILCLTFTIFPKKVFAIREIRLHYGLALGSLQLDGLPQASAVLGYGGLNVDLGVDFANNLVFRSFFLGASGLGFSLGGIFAAGLYRQDKFTYQTEISAPTAGPGLLYETKKWKINIFALAVINSRFLAKNISSGNVNGQDFRNSTLVRFFGPLGYLLRFTIRENKRTVRGVQTTNYFNIDVLTQEITRAEYDIVTPVRNVDFNQNIGGQLTFGGFSIAFVYPF